MVKLNQIPLQEFRTAVAEMVSADSFGECFRFGTIAGLRNSRKIAFMRILERERWEIGWFYRGIFHSDLDVRVKYCAYRLFRRYHGSMGKLPSGRSEYLPAEIERVVRGCETYPELVIKAQLQGFDCRAELVLLKLLNRGKIGILAEMFERESEIARKNPDLKELVGFILRRRRSG